MQQYKTGQWAPLNQAGSHSHPHLPANALEDIVLDQKTLVLAEPPPLDPVARGSMVPTGGLGGTAVVASQLLQMICASGEGSSKLVMQRRAGRLIYVVGCQAEPPHPTSAASSPALPPPGLT